VRGRDLARRPGDSSDRATDEWQSQSLAQVYAVPARQRSVSLHLLDREAAHG